MFAPPAAKLNPRHPAPPRSVAKAQRPRVARAIGGQPAGSADFSRVPLFADGAPEPSPAPRFPIQAKLAVGAADDPLEHEADRIAAQIMRAAEPDVLAGSGRSPVGGLQPRLGGEVTRDAPGREGAAPSPTSFEGRGEPLATPDRGFFERRFGCDFGDVRLHDGRDAAASARALGARAYTHGHDIVFGAGEYSPGSGWGRMLLAHELAHVVQQGAGVLLVQRSPLSDSVKDAWIADPTIETLLARLGQPDVQAARSDGDVDAEIVRLLAGRPEDLWLAQRIREGRLGQTTGALGKKDAAGNPIKRSIEAVFFRGSSDRRALVIAGVHGSEVQGIEVARMLIDKLKSQTPFFTTIIVPSLFPDAASVRSREGDTPTNRNFPAPSKDLAAAGGDKAVDARGRAILPENLLLLKLMEDFHPERIISIHGSSGAGSAGVFYDPRALRPEEEQAALDWASESASPGKSPPQEGEAGAEERMRAVQKALLKSRLAELTGQAGQADRDLSLKAAAKIDADTAALPGRGERKMGREKETKATTEANLAVRLAHPSIAGNIGPTGAIDNATWSGGVPGGISLGGYAPARGMSVFTVEPPLNLTSSDFAKAKDKSLQENRKNELLSYAEAVRTILLGAP